MNQSIESLPNDADRLKELVIRLQDKCTRLETELSTEQTKTKHQSDYINQLIEAIALAMQRIQLLYRIEKQAKDIDADQRMFLRQTRSIPILNNLRKWLDKHLPVVVKQSALSKAMYYMDKQWDKLTVYTTDGRLTIDNNHCENVIRPFVIGRKNHLFSDTVSGAKASNNLYSLIETAKANDLEPYRYLKMVFTALPKTTSVEQIEALLPFKPEIKLDEAA